MYRRISGGPPGSGRRQRYCRINVTGSSSTHDLSRLFISQTTSCNVASLEPGRKLSAGLSPSSTLSVIILLSTVFLQLWNYVSIRSVTNFVQRYKVTIKLVRKFVFTHFFYGVGNWCISSQNVNHLMYNKLMITWLWIFQWCSHKVSQ